MPIFRPLTAFGHWACSALWAAPSSKECVNPSIRMMAGCLLDLLLARYAVACGGQSLKPFVSDWLFTYLANPECTLPNSFEAVNHHLEPLFVVRRPLDQHFLIWRASVQNITSRRIGIQELAFGSVEPALKILLFLLESQF